MKYLIDKDDLRIRKMKDDPSDYDLLVKWLSTDAVLDYYEGRSHPYDIAMVIEKFAPRAQGKEAVIPCVIEYRSSPIGYIQYYRLQTDDLSYGVRLNNYRLPYAIDLFIGETEYWNKGIGTLIVKSMIAYLFTNVKADVIFIDPQTWNKRAIRCYEKSGFKPLFVMKNRELHEGKLKDSLIMSITVENRSSNYSNG